MHMTKSNLLKFLRTHRLGVLATVSSEGNPEAAVVGITVSENFEIVFDTIDSSRKGINLRRNRRAAFVIGWDNERTAQYEGIADEPTGMELAGLKELYFSVYPDGVLRQEWKGITYFRVRPLWIRYSDYNEGGEIIEFGDKELAGG
jgi:hypothetical protein